jgi:hypothetical protein
MKVTIATERSVEAPVPLSRVLPLLDDLESTIKRFPKLRTLKPIGKDAYLWEMNPIGSKLAKIAHEVSYGAKYSIDRKQNQVSWVPVPKQGNATIEGWFRFDGDESTTRLTFKVSGELDEVPVPLLYRAVAPAFIRGKFAALVDIFLERTRDALLQAAATPAAKPAASTRKASA